MYMYRFELSMLVMQGLHCTLYIVHYVCPLQACALIKAQDEKKIQLLYEFLAKASKVYSDVFPLM